MSWRDLYSPISKELNTETAGKKDVQYSGIILLYKIKRFYIDSYQ